MVQNVSNGLCTLEHMHRLYRTETRIPLRKRVSHLLRGFPSLQEALSFARDQ
jgi:hypothetical protein